MKKNYIAPVLSSSSINLNTSLLKASAVIGGESTDFDVKEYSGILDDWDGLE